MSVVSVRGPPRGTACSQSDHVRGVSHNMIGAARAVIQQQATRHLATRSSWLSLPGPTCGSSIRNVTCRDTVSGWHTHLVCPSCVQCSAVSNSTSLPLLITRRSRGDRRSSRSEHPQCDTPANHDTPVRIYRIRAVLRGSKPSPTVVTRRFQAGTSGALNAVHRIKASPQQ